MIIYLFIFVLILTSLSGFYDKSIPYFPIEISRTATGWLSYWIFAIGVSIVSIMFLYETKHKNIFIYSFISGLLLLAWIDDVTSWKWHMIGVLMIGISTIANVLIYRQKHLTLVLAASGLWVGRIILKSLVMVINETSFDKVKQESIKIMYTGITKHPDTLIIFKVAGVLQWIVFSMLIPIFI